MVLPAARYTGRVKIALAQINPTVGDFTGNIARILEFAERAKAAGAELAIFSELASCGYPPADFLEKKSFVERAEEALRQIAVQATGDGRMAVLCGGVMAAGMSAGGKHVRNVAALMDHGKIEFVQQKRLLPFYDVFDEQRYFEPAERQTICQWRGRQLAITICEDAWNDKTFWPRRFYRDDPVEELMQQWDAAPPSERIILNISSSPYWRGKRGLRTEMLAAIAARHKAWVVMVNQVGGNDSLIFDGTSVGIAPDGKLVAQARSFAEDMVLLDTDTHPVEAPRAEEVESAATWDALVLGTRDYVSKC